ncbi:MAG: Wzz/FepE/Etk N-terminal domain-containing protein [Rhodobacteraceae bacterium]|nr:Wzz/FepE/Etk N-terminal domain-containing protein [Paracoccaceae bacterium]
MNFDARFYLALLLRRLPWIAAIILLCTSLGVIVAYKLPPQYRAQARLLVESPQIPDDLAASTVRSTGEEILLAVQQRLLTRQNLLDISRNFGLHDDRPEMSPDQIVEDMHRRIVFDMPPLQGGTGVITVSFRSPDAESSAAVTNALVTEILKQNVELRTSASGSTLDFFKQEVDRLAQEMAAQNARILEFKSANRDALPESLEYRRSRQAAEQERLLQVDRELAGLRDRRQRLTDLYDRTGRLAASIENLTPEQARLEQLRQELASALVLYSPENPRVRALRSQVQALERAVEEQLGTGGGNGALTTFDLQMADIDGQIEFLADQKAILQREIEKLEESIAATPRNAIALGQLESDYENLRVQHDQAVASLAEARMGDRIEVTARGQRISVIEPASVPELPSSPNRKLISAAGLGAGVVLAAAFMFLLEVLNTAVRRPAELVSTLGITPFGTIPFVETRQEIRRRHLRVSGIAAFLLIGLPAALYAVHVAVMPLDALAADVAARLGLEAELARFFPPRAG